MGIWSGAEPKQKQKGSAELINISFFGKSETLSFLRSSKSPLIIRIVK